MVHRLGALFATLFLCRVAVADPGSLGFLDRLPPEPRTQAPAPARQEDEMARRPIEIAPEVGWASPICRGDPYGVARCADAASGPGFGGSILYRPTPFVALGGSYHRAAFRFSPGFAQGGASSARLDWGGLLARGYFADRGRIDAWVEAGLGIGRYATEYPLAAGPVSVAATGMATMVGAGVDVWITPDLKIGTALAYRFTFYGDLRVCAAGACRTTAIDDGGVAGSEIAATLGATWAIGKTM
jgi:hypothetical protein